MRVARDDLRLDPIGPDELPRAELVVRHSMRIDEERARLIVAARDHRARETFRNRIGRRDEQLAIFEEMHRC